jgi:hypothetical protein
MSRAAIHKDEFTPFGLWLKEYVEPCMTITNIDYFLLKITKDTALAMLVEEKTNAGRLTDSQRMALRFLHQQLTINDKTIYDFEKWGKKEINYWGFYILRFKLGATMPGPGMTLNNNLISMAELAAHLSFENKFCDNLFDTKFKG